MASLNEDEVHRFLAAADGIKYKDVFFVALYTGLRRSEVLALRWRYVDLENCTVNVVAGLHRLPQKGLVLLPTKPESTEGHRCGRREESGRGVRELQGK